MGCRCHCGLVLSFSGALSLCLPLALVRSKQEAQSVRTEQQARDQAQTVVERRPQRSNVDIVDGCGIAKMLEVILFGSQRGYSK